MIQICKETFQNHMTIHVSKFEMPGITIIILIKMSTTKISDILLFKRNVEWDQIAAIYSVHLHTRLT